MPLMDGYEATRRIRELAPDLPVIGLSAHSLPQDRTKSLASGMAAHLAKPVDVDELVGAVLRACGRAVPEWRTAVPLPPHEAGTVGTATPPPPVDWSGLASSLSATEAFVDKLAQALARNLDRVIDITFYPVEEARRSNVRHRPVGIGVQGLHVSTSRAPLRVRLESHSSHHERRLPFSG